MLRSCMVQNVFSIIHPVTKNDDNTHDTPCADAIGSGRWRSACVSACKTHLVCFARCEGVTSLILVGAARTIATLLGGNGVQER